MQSKEPITPQEIRDAIDYLRRKRGESEPELEMARAELDKNRNFLGCVGTLTFLFVVATIGTLGSGHLGTGLVLLAVALSCAYVFKSGRNELIKMNRTVEEMKRRIQDE